ncbi:UNKNOWN [Stylonychia lemnae]|uniref:Transmembrane protein n=1 Tax=Stylonychia lemnae TaxID=5949 RepID=A0A078AQG5_STYLE|nr:UNKNOWN [Stylonychia lemnae]|eukprot:CDW84675.1 UNKNOWN [Stylonychia lemnae]
MISIQLYLNVPGMVFSMIAGFVFVRSMIGLLQNRKKAIIIVGRIRQKTIKLCQINVDYAEKMISNLKNDKDMYADINVYNDYSSVKKLDTIEQYTDMDLNLPEILNSTMRMTMRKHQTTMSIRQDSAIADLNVSQMTLQEFQFFEEGQNKAMNQKLELKRHQSELEKQKKREIKKMIFKRIEKSFKQDRLSVWVKLVPASVVFSIFFIVMYLLELTVLDDTLFNLNLLKTFEEKESCLITLQQFTLDTIIENKTSPVIFINSNYDGLFQFCQDILVQSNLPRKKKNSQGYQISDILQQAENEGVCEIIDEFMQKQQKFQSFQKCDDILFGVLKKGMQQSYSQMLKVFRSININYHSSNKTQQTLQDLIADREFNSNSLTLRAYLRDLQVYISTRIHDRMDNFYESIALRNTIIFVIFVCLLIIIILLLLFKIVQFTKMEILYHRKIVKFIPITELERRSISNLLKTFDY